MQNLEAPRKKHFLKLLSQLTLESHPSCRVFSLGNKTGVHNLSIVIKYLTFAHRLYMHFSNLGLKTPFVLHNLSQKIALKKICYGHIMRKSIFDTLNVDTRSTVKYAVILEFS